MDKIIGITKIGKEIIFEPINKKLVCSNKNLVKLTIPKNINLKEIYCGFNYIEELDLNDNLKILDCSDNCLRSLKCNKSLQTLKCNSNHIMELIPNKQLSVLSCDTFVEIKYY